MVETRLFDIMQAYQKSFSDKVYQEENDDVDLLMDAFGLKPETKRENKQYWGRELGMCWQRLVSDVLSSHRDDYQPAIRIGLDEPCDMVLGHFAIDTKYRIGSGDSGTLKKFKQNGALLMDLGFQPICLVVRDDNLHAAISSLYTGGWRVLSGEACFNFLRSQSGFDLADFLRKSNGLFELNRQQ
jgi:hypothetical protein